MAEPKTRATDASVAAFLQAIPDSQVRRDSQAIVGIMKAATKADPRMWGTNIVGFGQYRVVYAGGREAEWMLAGFAPRKRNITLYMMGGFERYEELLADLGAHSCAKSCLYIKRLSEVHVPTLERIVRLSVQRRIKASSPARRKRSTAKAAGAGAGSTPARFQAVVLDGHKGLAFEISFDPARRWGAAQESLWPGRRGYRVRGTANKVRFESVVVPRARRFFVLVTDELRKAAKLRSGSSVRVFLSAAPAGARPR